MDPKQDVKDGPEQTQVVEQATEKLEWDKTRQERDQYKANTEKLVKEKQALRGDLESHQKRISELESQLRVNQKSQVEIKELDPLSADIPALVEQNKQLTEQLAKTNRTVAELTEKARLFETEREQTAADRQKQKVIDKVCGPLDEQYGAKYRSAAIALANQWTTEGTEPQPEDALDARDLMEKAYKAAKSKEKPKSEPRGPKTDSGAAGTSFEDIPSEGTRADVIAAMRKKIKRP